MDLIQLEIVAIRASDSQNNAYVLLLNEIAGNHQLPIVVGWCEARSIAIALDGQEQIERPLTHDLFKTFANSYEIKISKVIIHTLTEGIFHASFFCKNKKGQEKEIDARTSDAIAIAIRFGCPIFTHKEILKKAGIIVKKDSSSPAVKKKENDKKSENKMDSYNLTELKNLLNEAIEKENYEYASILRDEIKKRKK